MRTDGLEHFTTYTSIYTKNKTTSKILYISKFVTREAYECFSLSEKFVFYRGGWEYLVS